MAHHRPDPDELLRRVRDQESRARRGRLKIFFGASPGVGKTYTMLEAARATRRQGLDVVVGVVETHGRAETMQLTEGLEILPRRRLEYRGTALQEFDIDAALERRPALLLVDELAHTNAPGSRHEKRWQDVEELLSAGVNVWSTLNVQHVESLNDVVAQITGVRVRETVPDSLLEEADEVEMVDLTPDELLARLREGKVYVPDQAARAVEQFFRKGNLIALREMALRRTAERVDQQMRGYMVEAGIHDTWPAAERLAVCVGPSPTAERVVRAARRAAAAVRAPWFAVHVESAGTTTPGSEARDRVNDALRLAESLGAQPVTLAGLRPAEEILSWAVANNITRLLLGKPVHERWRDLLRGSIVDQLVRGSDTIEISVVTGDREGEETRPARGSHRRTPASHYLSAALVILVTTALCLVVRPWIHIVNIAMIFLLAVVVVAARYSRGPALAACFASIAIFDWAFVPPYYTFAVSDRSFVPTFGIMLAVAVIMSRLTTRIRGQADSARDREQRTSALYALSRDLAGTRQVSDLAAAAARQAQFTFQSGVMVMLPDQHGSLAVADPAAAGPAMDPAEEAVARWVFDHGQPAGLGTSTLPGARALWVPLRSSGHVVGVMGLRPRHPERFDESLQRQLLDAFTDQTAVALERALLARSAEASRVEVETERLRTALLSSLSHDLRTPLGAIAGAATTLLETSDRLEPAQRVELLRSISAETERMNRLIANLLSMVKVESGVVSLEREWQPLEEIVGIAIVRLEPQLTGREVRTSLPADLPLVHIDGLLMEQVMVNLLENAIKYTPAGSPIEITASHEGGAVLVEVADRGPGIPQGQEEAVFGKFTRLPGTSRAPGVGLGLAICRGIVQAHGGRIWVEARPGGGSRFRFTLPIPATRPA